MSAFDGSGTFVITGTGLPVVTNTVISSTVANTLNNDLAIGLSTCITKNGQTTVTANIPMSGFKVTGVGSASSTGDAIAYGRAGSMLLTTTLNGVTRFGCNTNDPTFDRANGVVISGGDVLARCPSANGWDNGVDATSGTNIRFYTDNGASRVAAGTISSSGSTTAYNTTSDERLKNVLKDQRNASDILRQIWVGDVEFKSGPGSRMMSVLAQQVYPLFPEAVTKPLNEDTDNWRVDYSKFVPLLIATVQSLTERVAALEA